MLLGLIFRERAKTKRSITSWRAEAKGLLPTTHDLRPQFARPQSGFVSNLFSGKADKAANDEKTGYGFGTAGEKKAGLKGTCRILDTWLDNTERSPIVFLSFLGFLISKPLETLPRYASPPRTDSPEPKFKSSNYAI